MRTKTKYKADKNLCIAFVPRSTLHGNHRANTTHIWVVFKQILTNA